MRQAIPGLLSIIFLALTCSAQTAQGTIPGPSISPQSTAPLPPSSPDMPMPDPASFPKPVDKSKSPAKRVVDKLTPVCMDIIFHTCLGPAGGGRLPKPPDDEAQFARNFEVGDMYFKDKNYRAAESRFREALGYLPHHPDATYKLAVSVDKLGRTDEASELYQSYLKLAPKGMHADKVQKRLAEMPVAVR